MTPRRAMDDAAMDMAVCSRKPATNIPTNGSEEGATDGALDAVVLGMKTTEYCHWTNRIEACHK